LKIVRITATPLHIPVQINITGKPHNTNLSVCLTEIHTDTGLVGHGFTAITEEEVVATIIDQICAPALIDESPLDTEKLWERLYWLLTPRGQSGYAGHAMAALDIALWDIKAKHLNLPLWRLLGGARSRVPVYATFGFGFYDRDNLAAAAKYWKAQGFNRLKMTVGSHALARRDEPRSMRDVINEDARRVSAVREAVGADVEIYVDANCGLDLHHATELAHKLEPLGVSLFEEPVTHNDIDLLCELRRRTNIRLAAGQNEALAMRFRDMLVNRAVDVLQPNVAITGGYTQCIKIAGMAHAFNIPIDNGGTWPYHNMHLHAGLMNGGMVEYHHVAVELLRQVYDDLPVPRDGWMQLPDRVGLGFSPNADRVRELAKNPLSRGKGKA
jgi:L-rhamnonate dehydratase